MCMPGTPEHDAYLKGPEAHAAFLREQETKAAGAEERQFDRSVERAEDEEDEG